MLYFQFKKALLLGFIVFITSQTFAQQKNSLKNGTWLGIITRPDSNQIQFNFTISTIQGKQVVHIINGYEKLLVDDITRTNDSILFTLPFFNASLIVDINKANELNGFYIKRQNDKSNRVPFKAYYGISERFPNSTKGKYSAHGTWDVAFKGRNAISKAIGNFVQNNTGKVTGSFLTPTGDYRFLEGIVSGDTLKLSGFDGGFASYFEAKFLNDSVIVDGKYFSGASGFTSWTAIKNDTIQLPDEYGYSKIRVGEEPKLNFKFKSTSGDSVSILDDRYKGKVVVVQILGSWCPNCMDETSFLSNYYNLNKARGFEIIGLAYERNDDYEQSKKALSIYQKRFNVKYPFLITGVTPSDPQRVEKTLPQIDKIAAFPTTIFIDKKGLIRKIHTGYDGPGTGKFFEKFKDEFNELVNDLISEK
jgi:thiol-disulfide isomerase/thioredoxin